MSSEIRACSRRKKCRVNIILTPIEGTKQHELYIYIKKDGTYRESTVNEYFKDEFLYPIITSPFSYLPSRVLSQKYSIKVYPRGGGLSSQAKALTLAIARALLTYYPEMRNSLRRANLLTQDSRIKERKKIGKYKARRSPQFTKR
ncbi:30S ribosomal protein S9 [Candidatus Mycoplasma haematolamae str. Purdue]|uniref:30S ribosomal protein S9 n=1 Tax=Mycoplasma haematolamae (strain Purdue) TaxID=1212765 RepID=I7CEW0_MYCHA|nr:30S ribosomal protein S9 [Candidatus Mycoplasma haematolamae]AFO51791.1 30S ribosomal protein S9 [Candidatus Mycoplasma haematolamae str. Purdue]